MRRGRCPRWNGRPDCPRTVACSSHPLTRARSRPARAAMRPRIVQRAPLAAAVGARPPPATSSRSTLASRSESTTREAEAPARLPANSARCKGAHPRERRAFTAHSRGTESGPSAVRERPEHAPERAPSAGFPLRDRRYRRWMAPALPLRPKLAAHVLARRHLVDGDERVVLHDLGSGGIVQIGPREWGLLAAADGTRDLEGILLAAAREGAHARAPALEGFLQQLHLAGMLADGGETAAEVAEAGTTTEADEGAAARPDRGAPRVHAHVRRERELLPGVRVHRVRRRRGRARPGVASPGPRRRRASRARVHARARLRAHGRRGGRALRREVRLPGDLGALRAARGGRRRGQARGLQHVPRDVHRRRRGGARLGRGGVRLRAGQRRSRGRRAPRAAGRARAIGSARDARGHRAARARAGDAGRDGAAGGAPRLVAPGRRALARSGHGGRAGVPRRRRRRGAGSGPTRGRRWRGPRRSRRPP